MNEAYLVERAESMTRHYRDAPKGAFYLAWRAMRLLESTRELARDAEVTGLVRGRGIPSSPVENFACAIVEHGCKLPAKGEANVIRELNEAAFVAWKLARTLRRRQILATAPEKAVTPLRFEMQPVTHHGREDA